MDLSVALAEWSLGSGPLYRRLATSLQGAIRRGEMAAGARLPSERDLARSLAVSRTTVVAAYRLLREQGLVERRRGSGTRVRSQQPGAPAVPAAAMPSLKLLSGAPEGVIDCSSSVLPDLEGIPESAVQIAPDQLRALAGEFDYRPLGLPPLRAAVADRFTAQGLLTTAAEVMITTGAQQAISLLFSAFGGQGSVIAAENPTYVGALDAARAAGATVLGVNMDEEGPSIGYLRDMLARSPVRLAYLMPAGQNPTGAVVPGLRRRQIVRAIGETGTPVVDDMTLADLMSDAPPRPLAALGEGTILTVGSLSKVAWAGLRVGWIRAAEPVIERLARLKVVADLGSSHPSQLLALQILSTLNETAATRRRQLSERMDLLTSLLTAHLPQWRWTRPPGGPFLWVRMPRGGAEAFAQHALARGVSVLPGSRLSPDGSYGDHLRVSCVATPDQLEQAAVLLAQAWASYEQSPVSGRQRIDVVV